MKRSNQKRIALNNVTVETMEDNATLNVGKNIVTGMVSTTKTNFIIGQITGDNTTSYLVSIDSDIYDSD